MYTYHTGHIRTTNNAKEDRTATKSICTPKTGKLLAQFSLLYIDYVEQTDILEFTVNEQTLFHELVSGDSMN